MNVSEVVAESIYRSRYTKAGKATMEAKDLGKYSVGSFRQIEVLPITHVSEYVTG
jgi:hypothetical protein